MKLASIEVIENIYSHPNADNLEIAKVLNWMCIVKKNKHFIGEKIVYISVDTLVPNKPWAEFLHTNKNKEFIHLKVSKLRGEFSYGLILPVTCLPAEKQNLDIGVEVSDILGIKKYEKYIPAHLLGKRVGPFPNHIIPQTDEENGLANPELIEQVLKTPVTITQKLDGSSGTVVIENGIIVHVCSRRMSLKEDYESSFWLAAKKIKLPNNWTGCIQAELVGPGIQKNQLKLFEPEFRCFTIKEQNGSYMNYKTMKEFCDILELKTVPLIELALEQTNLDELITIANNQTLYTGKPAEGIVVRPYTYESGQDGRPLGFKLINQNYKD